jgi:hypothetical protein
VEPDRPSIKLNDLGTLVPEEVPPGWSPFPSQRSRAHMPTLNGLDPGVTSTLFARTGLRSAPEECGTNGAQTSRSA